MGEPSKLACIVYGMLKEGTEYHEPDPAAYQLRLDKHRLTYFKKQAATLGFELTPNSVAIV